MKDYDFLMWLHERLEYVHKENPHVDYMRKLRAIILATPSEQETPNVAMTNNLDDVKDMLAGTEAPSPAPSSGPYSGDPATCECDYHKACREEPGAPAPAQSREDEALVAHIRMLLSEFGLYYADECKKQDKIRKGHRSADSLIKLVDEYSSQLAALRSRQSPQAGGKIDFAPAIDPVTGDTLFMWLEHPERGMVPTYGGPYDSYTLAERDDDESTPDEIHYIRYRYDHDEGFWIDNEVDPVRAVTITLDWLDALLYSAAPQPSPQGDDAGLKEAVELIRAFIDETQVEGAQENHKQRALCRLITIEDYANKLRARLAATEREHTYAAQCAREKIQELEARLVSAQSSAQGEEAREMRKESDYAWLDRLSDEECTCTETGPHCRPCQAGHALNEVAEILREARAALESNTKE